MAPAPVGERVSGCTGTPGDPDFAHAARLQAALDAAFVSDAEGRVVEVG